MMRGFWRVARLFGPIKETVGRTQDGGVFRYAENRQIIDSGFVMTDEIRRKRGDVTFGGLDDRRPGLFETFHVDDTYTEEPAALAVLHARQLPPSGGGPTCFLDMRGAYRQLDRATHVEDLDVAEGRALLQSLQDRAEAHAPACEHTWRDHDVLVWDNASVQHKAGGNFEVGEPHRFWPTMIASHRAA